MEMDVASLGTADQSPATASTPAVSEQGPTPPQQPSSNPPPVQQDQLNFSQQEQPSLWQQEMPSSSQQPEQPTIAELLQNTLRRLSSEKRRNNVPTHTLKSILRQRSDLASKHGHRIRRKKLNVQFKMEETPEEHVVHTRYTDQRLRHLALDLDRWDNVPALRSINKQKTRHTKRLKCCHSNEEMSHCKAGRPEMDDGASTMKDFDYKIGSCSRRPGTPENVPGVGSIETACLVERWLDHSSLTAQEQQQQQQPDHSNPVPSSSMSVHSADSQDVSPTYNHHHHHHHHHHQHHYHPYHHHPYHHSYYHHPLRYHYHCPTPIPTPPVSPSTSFSSPLGESDGLAVVNAPPPVHPTPLHPSGMDPESTSSLHSLTVDFNNTLSFNSSSFRQE